MLLFLDFEVDKHKLIKNEIVIENLEEYNDPSNGNEIMLIKFDT